MQKAKITEIFNSIQGEGLYVGEEQTFVRFYGCNLECSFCDEKEKTSFLEYTPDELIERISKEKPEVVSLTGGEPLLQAKFLKEVLPGLKEKRKRIYLETNGLLEAELLTVMDFIDVISMDIKLPSSTQLKSYWKEHAVFLKECLGKDVFVKSVVTPQTKLDDIEMAVSIIETIDKKIPFVIQPASEEFLPGGLISSCVAVSKEKLYNTRVIPQMHKILGVK